MSPQAASVVLRTLLALPKRKLAAAAVLSLVGVALLGSPGPRRAARAEDEPRARAETERPETYSPYADRRYPTRVYWGDQHLHTSLSADAGMVGDRLGPDDAFRFARGEQLRSSTGQLVRLERPFDWLVVSDHAEYMGMSMALAEALPAVVDTPRGKQWEADFKKGGKAAVAAYHQMMEDMVRLKSSLPASVLPKLARPTWERAIAAAERNY